METILLLAAIVVLLFVANFFRQNKTGDLEHVSRSMSARLLENLAVSGSNLEKEHILEQFFFANDKESLENVARKAEVLRYTVDEIGQAKDDDSTYFTLKLNVPIVPDLEAVERLVQKMQQWAEETGSEYDGWGASLVE
jgi:regulator of RNase E activity RraB